MAQGHVEAKEEWVEVSVEVETGLVPGFTGYPGLTTVESEWTVGVVVREEKTRLSVDMVKDMGSEHESLKRWCQDGGWCWYHYQMPVEGMYEVVNGRNLVLSLDKIEWWWWMLISRIGNI